MNFHERMMNIQVDQEEINACTDNQSESIAYKLGHRDARHAAAEIANEADLEIERLKKLVSKLENALQAALNVVRLDFSDRSAMYSCDREHKQQ